MTKTALYTFIKSQLGEPFVTIEISQDQMDYCIELALEKYTEFHYDGSNDGIMTLELKEGQTKYKLPKNVVSIFDVFPLSMFNLIDEPLLFNYPVSTVGGFSFYTSPILNYSDIYIWQSSLKLNLTQFRNKLIFNYNTTTNDFIIVDPPNTERTLGIWCKVSPFDYEADCDADQPIFDNHWFRRYCVCLVGLQWGVNISKFGGVALPGGATLNYADIIARYEKEKTDLLEELRLEYQPPQSFFFA